MSSLHIYMNGFEVGEYRKEEGGNQSFIYANSWRERNNATPLSLSMPLARKAHKGKIVHNYFDNLLPDSLDIRNRIQARVGAETNQAFDLLNQIGMDCIGAIQLLDKPKDLHIKQIEGTPVSDAEIAENLNHYKTLPLGMSDNNDFRISMAGAQEKTAYLWLNDQWHRPIHSTPTTHIFKLPIGINEAGIDLTDSVENEWLCLKILHAFNLSTAEAEIENFIDKKVLVVKRFDRKFATDNSWIIRHPQEDMCQAMGIAPGLKYESDGGPGIADIMQLLNGAIDPQKDRYQFMKTLFLFWVLGAIDGHGKNFSVLLKPQGRFQLTPVYDVMSAYPLTKKRQLELKKIKMAMAVHGKNTHYTWNSIQLRHWFDEAKRVRFPATLMQQIVDEVMDTMDEVIDWVGGEIMQGYPLDISDEIFAGMQRVKNKI